MKLCKLIACGRGVLRGLRPARSALCSLRPARRARPQVRLRQSKLLWLEAERARAVSEKSVGMAKRNAKDLDERIREQARQKGPYKCARALRSPASLARFTRPSQPRSMAKGVLAQGRGPAEALAVPGCVHGDSRHCAQTSRRGVAWLC